jgi:hypothetical protein
VEGIALAETMPDNPLCDNLLFRCSRLQRALKDYDGELKTLQKIRQDFRDSDVLDLVEKEIEKRSKERN